MFLIVSFKRGVHGKEREVEISIQSTLETDEVRDVRTTLGPYTQNRVAENKA